MTRRADPETLALARRMARPAEVSDTALIARDFARRLFAALKARTGQEIATLEKLLTVEGRRIADPHFDAAEQLFARSRIYVEPCRKLLLHQTYDMFVATWLDGTSRNVTPEELLAMDGQTRSTTGQPHRDSSTSDKPTKEELLAALGLKP